MYHPRQANYTAFQMYNPKKPKYTILIIYLYYLN